MPVAIRGLVAGLIGSLLLAVLMLLTAGLAIAPRLDTVRLLSAASADLFATTSTRAVGWLLFFVIGAVWGLLFAWIQHRLPGQSAAVRGMLFSLFLWGVMMIVFMPVAGAGWFGLDAGAAAPVITLAGHLIFGAVMGLCFKALGRS